ncbi:hypothetical protein IP88_10280 [alpha proteobacterium AAP81b]|nr:hypothetical protein IP88_10280 [alpha proteobacterium AAP81b]
MPSCCHVGLLLAVTLAPAAHAAASEDADLAGLVVTATEIDDRIRPPRLAADRTFLTERQPRSVAEMLRFLPGVSARTNSRGETVARVRGGDERQTQVFLDGAPLAVPWDGRIDLGVLPAGLVGSIEVAKGAVPIEYGTNAVAGVVDLRTGGRATPGGEARAEGGTGGFAAASALADVAFGANRVLVAASGVRRDAEPVADRNALPFSQAAGGGRTNSDLESLSLFGAWGHEGEAVAGRASLLHVATTRGIAPESDRNPAVAAPRYWRYPDIALTQATLSGSAELGAATLRAVAWQQWFRQTIIAYTDVSYRTPRTSQQDDDATTGGRLTLALPLGRVGLRLAGSAQTSRHAQVDSNLVTGVAGPRLVYRQNLFSIGAEVDVPIGPARATFGVAWDRASTPRTGDKPPQPDMDAVAFSAAVRGAIAPNTTLTLSGGRRTRFPSARELFGEALGRFLVNPALAPETNWLADLELAWQGRVWGQAASLVINPFYSRGEGTLGQRVVRVGGVALRQRYNLSGTQSFGVDWRATVALTPRLDVEAFGSALDACADAGDAAFPALPQRPEYEAGGALRWRPTDALSFRAEYRRVGPAVDLDAAGNRARLPPGDELNLRGRWAFASVGRSRLAVTLAVDNATDAVITPQLGLPLPGRTVRFGLSVD